MKQMHKHAAQVEVLRAVFTEIDTRKSKQVSMPELKEAMSEKKLASFMESMDISTKDTGQWAGSADQFFAKRTSGCSLRSTLHCGDLFAQVFLKEAHSRTFAVSGGSVSTAWQVQPRRRTRGAAYTFACRTLRRFNLHVSAAGHDSELAQIMPIATLEFLATDEAAMMLEQVVQEQNDILRRFMEAEFARQAVLLKEIQHEISLRGELPKVSLPAAASCSTEEPIQAQEVQEMVQELQLQLAWPLPWCGNEASVGGDMKGDEIKEETDLLSSWHPKPDHSKAVPNPGLEHDDDTIPAASVSERQVSVGSGLILSQKLSKEMPVSGGRHDEKEHGGRSGRPSWTGSNSVGLGSQLKNMLHGRQSVTHEKKDLNEHQRTLDCKNPEAFNLMQGLS
eukprot:s578_g3.t1